MNKPLLKKIAALFLLSLPFGAHADNNKDNRIFDAINNLLEALFHNNNNSSNSSQSAPSTTVEREIKRLLLHKDLNTPLKDQINAFATKKGKQIEQEYKYGYIEPYAYARQASQEFVTDSVMAAGKEYLKKKNLNAQTHNQLRAYLEEQTELNIQRNRNKLGEMLSNLNSDTQTIINNKLAELTRPAKLKSADDIVEHYPLNKAGEVRLLKEKNKIYENEDCVICGDSFLEIGKRVTLLCGHRNICPACLHKYMYEYNKATCPTCRAQILTTDFPPSHLKSM